ncbi:MAG: hypothetical protein AAF151_26510, partial [Cyanobacteria bacterium J06656_5]
MISHFAKLLSKMSGRKKSIALFATSSVGARGLGTICQIIQIPLIIAMAGEEGFGFLMTVSVATQMAAFADFGLGGGLQNRLTTLFTKQNNKEALDLFVTGFACLCAIAFSLFLSLGILFFVDINSLFQITDDVVRSQSTSVAFIAILSFCVGFPLQLHFRLAQSKQLGWLFNIGQVL